MIQVLRKEKKYILPRRAAMELERQLSGVMQLDANGVEGRYFIRSQYFDSLTDGDLQDNLAGLWEKSKLRLRIYSLDDQKAKLEWKRKFGLDSRKSSLTVTRAQALQMEQGDAAFLLDMDSQLARQIYCRFTAASRRGPTGPRPLWNTSARRCSIRRGMYASPSTRISGARCAPGGCLSPWSPSPLPETNMF